MQRRDLRGAQVAPPIRTWQISEAPLCRRVSLALLPPPVSVAHLNAMPSLLPLLQPSQRLLRLRHLLLYLLKHHHFLPEGKRKQLQ